MASARDIKRKISSVQSTQKITKAMKMVSAAKMRRAIEAMTSARPYSNLIGNFSKPLFKWIKMSNLESKLRALESVNTNLQGAMIS